MEATRTRSAVFFIQYLVLLLAALVWVNTAPVRARVDGHLTHFYWLIGGACGVLGLRAYLVLRTRIGERANAAWDVVDLGVISGAVHLTGGINSEAALVYFWPIITTSIVRLPRRTLAIGAASGLLYTAATWSTLGDPKYPSALLFRLLILALVTWMAVQYARTEQERVEEMARLRAQVRLSEERQQLAREMHDGLQHYLADIVVRLELARQLMRSDPEAAARRAVDQRFTVRQAGAELRYMVRLLRSPAVERANLVDALQHHLAAFAERAGVSAPLEIEGEVRPLPPEVKQAALRILQESVMNAEKYAQASEVKVTLSYRPDRFTCTVRDDGVGFEPAPSPQAGEASRGFGLESMAQRAQSVGGTVEVQSAPGAGTVVTFAAPLGEAVAGERKT